MAMPSGNVVISDKVQFPGGSGGEAMHYPRGWFPDERDGFISWLRGEFAAANAIIDSLCHHLRVIGDPGEYDGVVGCIQQRRCNWNPVLHMQQYFSVAEVMHALQQVTWRRQQRFVEPVKTSVKEFRRSGGSFGGRQGPQRGGVVREVQNYSVKLHNQEMNENGSDKGEGECKKGEEAKLCDKGVAAAEENKGAHMTSQVDKDLGNAHEVMSGILECETEMDDGCVFKGSCDVDQQIDTHSTLEKQNSTVVPKAFVANEIYDGKMVNVVDGMKLYEDLLNDSEVMKFAALVNDMRADGRKGQFQGQTFAISKRPMRGHGRETIQLGIPVVDVPLEDEVVARISEDQRIEPIPDMLQGFVERLISMEVVTVKPDSCVIDIFNEGDHSQPHMWPYRYGRPVCVLFLTECDMTFGKVIGADYPGHYRGSLKLSLSPGSLLVIQGRSADFSKHALPSIRKQRILVTLTKSLPKKTTPGDGHHFSSTGVAPSSHWVPPPSRSPNHVRNPMGAKHYGPVRTAGVWSAAPSGPQLPPNGVQPIFGPAPAAPAGWPVAAPRHPPPRILVPGTGVFLPPPGSGNSTAQSLPSTTSETYYMETPSMSGKDNISGKSNGCSSDSSKTIADGKVQQEESNDNMDRNGDCKPVKDEQQQSDDVKAAGDSDEAILVEI